MSYFQQITTKNGFKSKSLKKLLDKKKNNIKRFVLKNCLKIKKKNKDKLPQGLQSKLSKKYKIDCHKKMEFTNAYIND
jgi:DNA primase catalytic subunit